MTHLLDQPVWNAMLSGNSNLSYGTSRAKYFDKTVSIFADVENQDSDDFQTLYDIIPAGQQIGVFSINIDLKAEPWSGISRIDGLQMTYNHAAKELTGTHIIRPLDISDVPAMLSLTGQMKPGPFFEKTIDFGHYHGIFSNDILVAMAGQRFHPGAFAEISGVCTHPDFTGKGLARQLLLHQIKRIMENDETPFLHVTGTNLNAIKLYESIGFVARTEIYIHILRK
ncbi:GNAT family N-acetyltransferase [Pedobacter hartonius]|uniref:FR47-like protein n=1 Tax=Pedobacter hartonius TaxID=425514 RepID=A0A1H4GAQ9_9SPHI|nr:GNAT family N-acetyltransferase [Pedobacter hartonius]SEB06644.1 FR47-like protein [Pedobacter hartonius]